MNEGEGIAFIITICLGFIFMSVWNFRLLTKKPDECISTNKTVYISDRLESCEAKGGKYTLMWINDEYKEFCEIQSQNIEDF